MNMEEYRDQYTDAVKVRDALTALLASEGWEYLNAWLEQEIKAIRHAYETSGPITDGNIYANEYRRAQLNMLLSLQRIPDTLLTSAQEAINSIKTLGGEHDGWTGDED